MSQSLDSAAIEQLFVSARTHNAFQKRPVADQTLKALYDTLKWGPTSMNGCPARFVFVRGDDAKARLKPLLARGNVESVMNAPVTAIVGYDTEFQRHLPRLFPHAPNAASMFDAEGQTGFRTAFRNSSLQGAYLILAARALGLDCGPMSGFDEEGVTTAFFAGTTVKANFICNLGYGVSSKVYPRGPRFDFDEVCEII